jgi:hypothetical protein
MIGMCCCYVVAYDKVFGIASATATADAPQ